MIRNGECGEWRLSDEEFLRTFRPPSDRPCGLAQRNPLPREERVVFVATDHAYYVDEVRVPISVVGFMRRLSAEFDPHAVAQAMMGGPGWPERQHDVMNAGGTIKTAEEIVDAWVRNGERKGYDAPLSH